MLWVTLKQGRLCQSLEGAGKRRLFVIGNYFKQRLLYPVHVWAMAVLRSLPTDGTFQQGRPIQRLVDRGLDFVASFDLSSATDRWPVPTIHDLVACIFGPTTASCIVNGSLALNSCEQQLSKKPSNIVFVAGQPLGYYGSWALFALTHHFVVWLAADKAYPTRSRPFHRYALLGDDVVLADKAVAVEYRKYLDLLQVKISDAKSIVSDRGAFEFAKQFWVGRTNLSPVSAKAVLKSYSITGVTQLGRKYNLSEKTCVRLAGGGYRVLARLDRRGLPISPYTMGTIVQKVRDQLKLKQLQLVPEERFWGEGELWTTENQLYRNWLSDWLQYLKWYVVVSTSAEVTLCDLLSPPVVSCTWKRRDDDVIRHRHAWSILYKLYDWAEGKNPGTHDDRALIANWPALPSHVEPTEMVSSDHR